MDKPKPLTTNALDMMFMRLTVAAGIRVRKSRRYDRQDVMLLHGIRKYVNHSMVNSGVNVIAKELLIGHAAPGLEGSYLRPTESELLTEFVKAIPALSLSQEAELVQETERLRIEAADTQMLRQQVALQNEQISTMQKENEERKRREDEITSQLRKLMEHVKEVEEEEEEEQEQQ
jgi:hypothetical protein